jgi:hypothetical protein
LKDLIGLTATNENVGSLVQPELVASNGDSCKGAAGRGDRASAAKSSQPDHNFVLGGAGGGCAGEEVVRNVGDDRGAGVGPVPSGGERADVVERLVGDLGHNVGVGLDVSGTRVMSAYVERRLRR